MDPTWKSIKMGKSDTTIGFSGSFLTSLTMLIRFHGYDVNPETLNTKLEENGGYIDAAILPKVITSIYPQIVYKDTIECTTTDAPLSQIDTFIESGQPVVVELDVSPDARLITHYVVLYAKQGMDYLILDPWPYPPDNKDASLVDRYGFAGLPNEIIIRVFFFEHETP